MDDNWIQIMYKYKEIKKTHLEISSLCQASCPMCARNYHGGLPNPNLPESNLSLELFKKAHTPELLERLESMSFCGNYGDPILNNDLIDMIRYVTQYNTTLHMDVHTNASARNEQWWKDLAKALGRIEVIGRMYSMSLIQPNDRVHLLGCQVPQEFSWYKDMPFIETIDTSNPVMATLDGIKYGRNGLTEKPKANMNDHFYTTDIDYDLLDWNLKTFKKLLK